MHSEPLEEILNRENLMFVPYGVRGFESISKDSGWQIKKFADKLKDIVCILIGCTRSQLEDREFKETELGEEWWYYKGETGLFSYTTTINTNRKLPLIKTTPRLLLQLLGTDCGRKILHPNIWCNALFAEYNHNSYWVITDVRFPNEAEAIKSKGGIIIRVNRPCKECNGMGYHKMGCNIGRCEHESEYSLDNYTFDYVLNNDGSIEDLYNKMKEYGIY